MIHAISFCKNETGLMEPMTAKSLEVKSQDLIRNLKRNMREKHSPNFYLFGLASTDINTMAKSSYGVMARRIFITTWIEEVWIKDCLQACV